MVLAPLWWFLGLNLWIYHAAAAGFFFVTVFRQHSRSKGLYIPAPSICLLVLLGAYAFSLLIHAPEHGVSRVLAACYNMSYWAMGLFLLIALSNSFADDDVSLIHESFYRLGLFLAVLSLGVFIFILTGGKNLVFSTPFSALADAAGDTMLVKQSVYVMIVVFDWFAAGERARFNAVATYPTATAAVIMMVFMVILSEGSAKKRMKTAVLGLLLLGLTMTLARMTVVSLVISLTAIFLVKRRRFILECLGLVTLGLWASPWLIRLMNFLWGLREGSGTTRLDIYIYSLQRLQGADWILGLGIKPREDFFDFPIGSHSTIISLIYKTGLIGALAFILFQGVLFLRWYQLKDLVVNRPAEFSFWRGLGMVFIGMGLWSLTEDLDAPQIAAFMYFSMVGIFEGFRRRILEQHALVLSARAH